MRAQEDFGISILRDSPLDRRWAAWPGFQAESAWAGGEARDIPVSSPPRVRARCYRSEHHTGVSDKTWVLQNGNEPFPLVLYKETFKAVKYFSRKLAPPKRLHQTQVRLFRQLYSVQPGPLKMAAAAGNKTLASVMNAFTSLRYQENPSLSNFSFVLLLTVKTNPSLREDTGAVATSRGALQPPSPCCPHRRREALPPSPVLCFGQEQQIPPLLEHQHEETSVRAFNRARPTPPPPDAVGWEWGAWPISRGTQEVQAQGAALQAQEHFSVQRGLCHTLMLLTRFSITWRKLAEKTSAPDISLEILAPDLGTLGKAAFFEV